MKKALVAGAALALGLTIVPAQAVTVVGPSASPGAGSCASISFVGISPIECAGGYDGNLLKGSVSDATGLSALSALGAPGGTFLEKLEKLNGNTTINFATPLTGITVFALHYGGGGDNSTSFFKFDAGAGVDSFVANIQGSSNAAIFKTGGPGGGGNNPGGVPEPATWAMMLLGFGAIGAAMRRRQSMRVKFA